MAKKRDEEGMRARLLEAAQTVFRRGNPLEITMNEISVEAGLAKGTIYLYFKNKDELMVGMFRHCITQSRGELSTFLETRRTLPEDEQLRQALDFVATEVLKHQPMWGIWYQFLALASASRYRATILEIAQCHRSRRDELVMEIISRGIKAGIFRSDICAAFKVASLFALLEGLIVQVYTESLNDLRETFHKAAEPIIEGMLVAPSCQRA